MRCLPSVEEARLVWELDFRKEGDAQDDILHLSRENCLRDEGHPLHHHRGIRTDKHHHLSLHDRIGVHEDTLRIVDVE